MMKRFEIIYNLLQYFEHPLYHEVNNILKKLTKSVKGESLVLDVGGRKSNYTVGLPCKVWISDIPRETEIQEKLELGTNEQIMKDVIKRRSNIEKYVIDDMTDSKLGDSLFDVVVAIEVLEHVEKDEQFVANVSRVLKPDGYFVMTTPNGDDIPIPFPDHKRHYKLKELRDLLSKYFDDVDIVYSIKSNSIFRIGRFRWSAHHPVRTFFSMIANFIHYNMEKFWNNGKKSNRNLHLLAICSGRIK